MATKTVRTVTTAYFTLERDGKRIPGRVVCDRNSVEIYIAGYGNAAMKVGEGSPIMLEVGDNGHPVLHAYAELDSQEPTHSVSLAKAFECYPVGTKLVAKERMEVDADENDVPRYAEAGEEANIGVLNTDSEGDFINYQVTFPLSGAWGFYNAAEINQHFTVAE